MSLPESNASPPLWVAITPSAKSSIRTWLGLLTPLERPVCRVHVHLTGQGRDGIQVYEIRR
jgi:hypothetical protein